MNVRLITLMLCLAGSSVFAQEQETAEPATPKRQVPEVFLSAQHQEMVATGVGAGFPDVDLPSAASTTDPPTSLAELRGSKATVVAVFSSDRAMAKSMLRDLQFDIADRYQIASGEAPKVTTIAIATGMAPGEATNVAGDAKYTGPMLLDEQGTILEKLGTGRMPRIYVLNADGKVAWFDIEYSLSTRRELKQAVRVLGGKPAAN